MAAMQTESANRETTMDRGRQSASRRSSGTPHSDELRDSLMEAGDNLRQVASNMVPAAKEQVSRMGDSVADRAESLEESIEARIREKPISSMLIAAAVGVVLGALFLRR